MGSMTAVAERRLAGGQSGVNVGAAGAVARALDGLAAEQVEGIGVDVLAAEIATLHRQISRLQAQLVRRLAAFDVAGGPEGVSDGAAGSLQAWVRRRLREAPGAAKTLAGAAGRWEALPEVAGAFVAGDLGLGHVRVITQAATDWRLEAVQQVEGALVEAARALDARQLGQVVARVRTAADPDGAAKAVTAGDRRRRVEVGVLDGMLLFDGALPMAAGGEEVLTVLDALERPDPPETPIPSRRSRPQRLADALVDLARLALDGRATPQVGGERPHVTVTVAVDPAGSDGSIDWGELGWGGVVGLSTVERLCCDAQVTRVVTDLTGNPRAVDQTRRSIPAWMRKALVARDRGCRGPFCDRPAVWGEAHHVRHRARHGEHDLSNLVLVCRRCHMLAHERGWEVRLRADATVEWTDTSGRTFATVPDPAHRHTQHALDQLVGRAPP